MKATFDLNSKEGKMRLFNAKCGTSSSMKNLESGTVIEVEDVLIYEDTVDSFGKPQDVEITVLFATDGTSYASVSDSVARASDNLIDLVADLDLDKYNVRIIKAKSKGGNEFLNLQLV